MNWRTIYPYSRILINSGAIFFYTVFATDFVLGIIQEDNSLSFWSVLTFVSLTALTVYNSLDVRRETSRSIGTQSMSFSAPGAILFQILDFTVSKKTFETIYVPIIADMREEYFEAHSQNRIWKARWVRIRGTYSFFAAMGLDRVFASVSFFVKAWKSVN